MSLPFGRYQLLRKIASGGMGQVFLARAAGASGFDKLLVIKRILPYLAEDEEFLAMFLDEARIAARLNHPNLVQIFELGEALGSTYLAMEYVPGEDLRRLERRALDREKPLPIGLACRIIADAASGLHHAHQARDPQGRPLNLIHRDVSPQNILVGFSGAVKLIDFGVAKAAGSSQKTASGVLKGKYPYLSPEQATGKPLDPRSDQFSLGVTFWELLTGRRLFKGDNDLATLERVKACEIPPPSELAPQVPEALDALVLRTLAKRPEDRFPDCGAFMLALEDFTLAHKLPASTAHLGAWLRELYADRMEQEEDEEQLDRISTSAELDAIPTPLSETVKLQATRAEGPAHTLTASPPKPKPERRAWRGIGLLAAGIVAVAVAAWAVLPSLGLHRADAQMPRRAPARTSPPPSSSTQLAGRVSPAPRPAKALEPAAVAPKKPETKAAVLVRSLSSVPPGAEVEVSGKRRGRTPLTLDLPADASTTVWLRLAGYRSRRVVLSEDGPKRVRVHLERARPRLEIKTGR